MHNLKSCYGSYNKTNASQSIDYIENRKHTKIFVILTLDNPLNLPSSESPLVYAVGENN